MEEFALSFVLCDPKMQWYHKRGSSTFRYKHLDQQLSSKTNDWAFFHMHNCIFDLSSSRVLQDVTR